MGGKVWSFPKMTNRLPDGCITIAEGLIEIRANKRVKVKDLGQWGD